MRRLASILALFLVLLSLLPAAAQSNREKARSGVASGQTKFEEGRYAEAVVDFLQAFQIDPHPIILYNVARAYEEQGDLIKSLGYYRTALGLGPSPAVKAELDKKIKDLEFFLRSQGVDVFNLKGSEWVPSGVVTIRVDPPGAEILIDGQAFGRSPIEEQSLPQGTYMITARSPGFVSQERVLEVVGGKRYTLTPMLEPGLDTDPAQRVTMGTLTVDAAAGLTIFVGGEPVATTPAGRIDVAPGTYLVSVEGEGVETYEETVTVVGGEVTAVVTRKREIIVVQEDTSLLGQSGWGWLVTGVGMAVLGGGATFGVLAQGNAGRYAEERGDRSRPDFRSAAQTQGLVADGMYVLGGAMVITGLTLVITEPPPAFDAPGAYERISLGPMMLPGGAGATAVVTW
jgi:hypothetical protein